VRGWIKLDDGMPEHPKIEALAGHSAWAFVCSLAYSSRNLTDGFVPQHAAHRMADDASGGRWHEVRDELVAAVLWEPVENGYKIHDYLDYQRSKTEVIGLSKVRAEAGRRGGKASTRARNKQTRSKIQPEQELEQERKKTRVRAPASDERPRAPAQTPEPDHDAALAEAFDIAAGWNGPQDTLAFEDALDQVARRHHTKLPALDRDRLWDIAFKATVTKGHTMPTDATATSSTTQPNDEDGDE